MARFGLSIEKKLLLLILLVGMIPAIAGVLLASTGGGLLFSQAMRGQLEARAREISNLLENSLDEQDASLRALLAEWGANPPGDLGAHPPPQGVAAVAVLNAPGGADGPAAPQIRFSGPTRAAPKPDGLDEYMNGLARAGRVGAEGYDDTVLLRSKPSHPGGEPRFEPFLVRAYRLPSGALAAFLTAPRDLLRRARTTLADQNDVSLFSGRGFMLTEGGSQSETAAALRERFRPRGALTGVVNLHGAEGGRRQWRLLAYSAGRRMVRLNGENRAGAPWAVVITYDMEIFLGSYSTLVWFSVCGAGLWGALLMGISVAASRRITSPLLRLRAQAEAVAAGNLDAHATVDTLDEAQDLATAFNLMADKLKESHERITRFNHELEHKVLERTRDLARANQKLLQTEKYAAMGRLAASLAHEINNPLGIIKNYVRLVRQAMEKYSSGGGRRQTDPNLAHMATINEELDRIARIVRQLLDLHRPPDQTVRETNLNQMLEAMLSLMEKGLTKDKIYVHRDFAPGLPTLVIAPDLFQQVFMNLVRNAADAMEPNGGEITVKTETRAEALTGGERALICITVSDTGPGIPEEIMGHIFDPFFTTKPPDKGTGLGLAVSYGVVRKYGGWIDVASKPGEGAAFTVCLPVQQRPAAMETEPATADPMVEPAMEPAGEAAVAARADA